MPTDDQIIAALHAACGQVYLAAERLGCAPDTLISRVRKSPAIAAVLEASRGKLVDTAEAALYRAILEGESWAVKFALETQGQQRGYAGKNSTSSTNGPGFLARSGCVTVQEVMQVLLENDDYLDYCRSKYRPQGTQPLLPGPEGEAEAKCDADSEVEGAREERNGGVWDKGGS